MSASLTMRSDSAMASVSLAGRCSIMIGNIPWRKQASFTRSRWSGKSRAVLLIMTFLILDVFVCDTGGPPTYILKKLCMIILCQTAFHKSARNIKAWRPRGSPLLYYAFCTYTCIVGAGLAPALGGARDAAIDSILEFLNLTPIERPSRS